jgi:hypothetical protein
VTGTAPEATNTAAVTVSVGDPAPTAAPTGNIGDFGSCSVPEIEFGVGFDGRKETSFQPVDKGKSSFCVVHRATAHVM